MPSPQSLVTLVTLLFVLLIATHVYFGMQPGTSAVASTVIALVVAAVVDRFMPPDVDDSETAETSAGEPETHPSEPDTTS